MRTVVFLSNLLATLAPSSCARSQRCILAKTEFFRSLLSKRDRIGAAVATDNGAFEVGRPACIGPGSGDE